MLSNPERRVLSIFREFQVGPNQMLCFNSQQVKSYRHAFKLLMEKGYLIREEFSGAFSLTHDGFAAMKKAR